MIIYVIIIEKKDVYKIIEEMRKDEVFASAFELVAFKNDENKNYLLN